MWSTLRNFSFYFVPVLLTVEISHYLLEWLMKRNNAKEDISKLIIFPDPGYLCSQGLNGSVCRNKSCKFIHEQTSLEILLTYLRSAKRRLDICVYLISSHILVEEVLKCHENGIKIRVITDLSNTGEEHGQINSQIGRLRRNGIPVRCNSSSFWMHHKFAIVDEQLLITGSFNWTNQAIMGNNENIIITNNKNFVTPLRKEFNILWTKYDPKHVL